MRDAALPVEFRGLVGKVNYVRQVSSVEWSSSCPQCGGEPHKGGELPDRFRMWIRNRKGNILGWCRRCGYTWFPKSDKPIDPQEFEKWRMEQLQIERKRKADAEKAIALLQSEKPWLDYYARLNQWALDEYAKRGITKEYVDYWKLGLNPDFIVNGEYHSPALTIPLWQRNGIVSNVKLRVLNPKDNNDRYRNLFKIGTGFPFFAWGADVRSDTCLIVEGEFKSMIAAAYSDHTFEVIGIPTKTPNAEVLTETANFAKAIVCLDPDAHEDNSLKRLVDMLPVERVAVVQLPEKVDDMIVNHGLDIMDAMRYAKIWR